MGTHTVPWASRLSTAGGSKQRCVLSLPSGDLVGGGGGAPLSNGGTRKHFYKHYVTQAVMLLSPRYAVSSGEAPSSVT